MQTFKASGSEFDLLRDAAITLKEANSKMADGEKAATAAKKRLADWLQEKRGLNLETLKIGEMVQIEGVALIEIGKQNKFDVSAFMLSEPELHLKFKKDMPIRKYKSLA